MVDKIDPTNQTSVEYGQSLLGRKYEQDAKYAKDARKDRKINYAMQVLGGVDNLIKDRARRNMAERNSEITQQILREEAEFNELQKEYNTVDINIETGDINYPPENPNSPENGETDKKD